MNSLKKLSILIFISSLAFLTYTCTDSGTGGMTDTGNDNTLQEFNSRAAPGDSAASFLQSDQFTNLQLEIDFMSGHEPTQEGLDSLRAFLEKRLNKQNVTLLTPTEVSSGGQSSYTANEIRNLEDQHRNNFTETGSNTLHAYFLIVDGEFEQSNVLGIAYWNTSMAFFGQTIEDVSSGVGAPPREKIEATVFNHEFGHNMGLVGNGSPHPPGQQDHETSGSAHCTVDGCLMEPSVLTTDFFANVFDGNIRDLDPLCIEDLQANGGR